jgi:hypothetical protein
MWIRQAVLGKQQQQQQQEPMETQLCLGKKPYWL